jgi:deazaflavin-dependent oxidoreductase (nitroreductase family)
VDYGGSLLVVGSNWARPHHPEWTANFIAAETVRVDDGQNKYMANPEHLTGPDRQRAWLSIVDQWPNYQIAQDLADPGTFRIFKLTRQAAKS